MRKFLFFEVLAVLVVFTTSHRGYAQIPNPGFENWTAGSPDSWFTNNTFLWTPVTQTINAHSGSSSVAGTAVQYSTSVIRPLISAGTTGTGFPVSSRQAALHGWYEFVPKGADNLIITVVMSKGGTGIGAGGVTVVAAQTTFTEFIANIHYATADVPDTCYITVSITGSGAQPGSIFVMDDLTFGAATTSVEAAGSIIPPVYELVQNYPNPFNPSTQIRYSLPQAGKVSLVIYDVLGREMASLADGYQQAGRYTTTWNSTQNNGIPVSSGVYYARLRVTNDLGMTKFTKISRLLLMR
jgi:hypothetical protein